MLKQQTVGAMHGGTGASPVDPIYRATPETRGGTLRLAGVNNGHLCGHGRSRHERAPRGGGARRRGTIRDRSRQAA